MGTSGYYGGPQSAPGQVCPEMMLNPSLIDWYASWWASDPAVPTSGPVEEWPTYTGVEATLVPQGPGQSLAWNAAPSLNDKQAAYSTAGYVPVGVNNLAATQPLSVVVIAAVNVIGDQTARMVGGHVSVGWVDIGPDVGVRLYAGSVAVASPLTAPNRSALHAAFFDNLTGSVWVNDESVLGGIVGTATPGTLLVGGDYDGLGGFFSFLGDIAFVGLYEGDVLADPGWPLFAAQAAFDYALPF